MIDLFLSLRTCLSRLVSKEELVSMERLTIDEAIEQEKFKARVDRIKANKRIFNNNDKDEISACNRSAEEHEQLAERLEELKAYIEIGTVEECRNSVLDIQKAYNKAIDDAMVVSAKSICVGCGYLDGIKCKYKGGNCGVSKPMLETVIKALKQLKAGEENE